MSFQVTLLRATIVTHQALMECHFLMDRLYMSFQVTLTRAAVVTHKALMLFLILMDSSYVCV